MYDEKIKFSKREIFNPWIIQNISFLKKYLYKWFNSLELLNLQI